jgi:hypothetical protein
MFAESADLARLPLAVIGREAAGCGDGRAGRQGVSTTGPALRRVPRTSGDFSRSPPSSRRSRPVSPPARGETTAEVVSAAELTADR